MKRISDIRIDLKNISGALSDIIPPETSKKGEQEALTIYRPDEISALDSDFINNENPISDSISAENNPIPYFELPPEIEKGNLEKILSDEAGNDLERALKVDGMDAHGWYVSFHYTGPQWGIYIPKSEILKFAIFVFRKLKCNPEKMMELAFESIYRHELCHFFIDYIVAQRELISGSPHYLKFKQWLKKTNQRYFPSEEKIANAWMLRGLKYPAKNLRASGALELLRKYSKLQPAGYNEGYTILDKPQFICELEGLIYEIACQAEVNHLPSPNSVDVFKLFPLYETDAWKYCPIHIVNDTSDKGLPDFEINLFPKISNILESEKFSKKIHKQTIKIQNNWRKAQDQIAISTGFKGLDFKKFTKVGENVFSIRLDSNIRVHLIYEKDSSSWVAYDVGSHREMGHG
tara:strand:- start:308 stop:1522 length:1215 start_codon:yes stop_codon:yes gene_type:complete